MLCNKEIFTSTIMSVVLVLNFSEASDFFSNLGVNMLAVVWNIFKVMNVYS